MSVGVDSPRFKGAASVVCLGSSQKKGGQERTVQDRTGVRTTLDRVARTGGAEQNNIIETRTRDWTGRKVQN